MSRITIDDVTEAIRKVRSMSLREKEALAEEIHLCQPHMLASCLVQSKLGVNPAAVEFLLNILLVCYQSMKESGLQWSVITEDEQERQMQRWIGAVHFSERAVGAAGTTNLDDEPRVRCRRRPGRPRCTGIVMSYPAADDLDRIYWYCPVCNDSGFISGWQNTLWDGSAANDRAH